MRKIISLFFIFIGLALLTISSSNHMMNKITAERSDLDGWLGTHRWTGGDLVSMSYLDHVNRFQEKDEDHFVKPLEDSGGRHIDLYVYGDSYLLSVPDSAFGYVNRYHFGRRTYENLNYSLDPHKKNILIIEFAERLARNELGRLEIYHHLKKKEPESSFRMSAGHPAMYANMVALDIFSHEINRNLEFNLYGYRFWDQIKLAKVSLTYDLFKRAVGDVVISDDGSRLFLRQTIAPNDISSSYSPVDRKEMQKMIDNIQGMYDHYKAEGFDEVYLSLIPNPVTILQPLHYNGLIPELQKAARLKGVPVIDVYSSFSSDSDPGRLFRIGDTHWSHQGIQLWLETVNGELRKQNRQMVNDSINHR
ncbi:MAG TPA: hypothetical protein VFI33_10960 [Puia sp.]|nr:hypothetical protein [Puia sp.]